ITPRGLRLIIENLEHPAYLLNNKFEVEWSNAAAEAEIFGKPNGMPKDIADRNVFSLLFGGLSQQCVDRATLFAFHLEIAKNRMSKANLLTMDPNLDEAQIEELSELYSTVEAVSSRQLRDTDITLGDHFAAENRYRLYASFFREGVFFAYNPAEVGEDSLLQILSRRDLVIRDLLRNWRPYVTPRAALVADLQNSVKICAELPPDEYFELINQIWRRMEPIFRKYHATQGKHVGEGIVYYFFPQAECNYVLNAIECAWEMIIAMQEIDREWQARKNWANSLKLNIGLDEGQEWFGAYQTTTHLELTVLGDTINQAARLSDFARTARCG
ncbi:MAG: adenylate/guanylate cyclase domain-containing protein, partial [Rhodospirillaceae bacterium]